VFGSGFKSEFLMVIEVDIRRQEEGVLFRFTCIFRIDYLVMKLREYGNLCFAPQLDVSCESGLTRFDCFRIKRSALASEVASNVGRNKLWVFLWSEEYVLSIL